MRVMLVLLTVASLAWAASLSDQAKKAQEQKDYQGAIRILTEAINRDPNNAKGYVVRCIFYGESGDHSKAVDDCTRAIKLDSTNARAYHNRGVSYIKLGDRERAVQDAQKACSLGMCELAETMKKYGIIGDVEQQPNAKPKPSPAPKPSPRIPSY